MTVRTSILSLFCLFLSVQGCTSQTGTPSLSITPDSEFELGVIRGALTLTKDPICQRFVAESLDAGDEVFAIDIEQAQVRNHQYSFLHHLDPDAYETRGRLECDQETFYSLPARFVVNQNEETQVQYRFFFDVEENLNQVDLLFCAELLLAQVAPIDEACIEEPIQLKYDLDWLREDCGSVYLHLQIGSNEEVSPAFAFPDESTYGVIEAPRLPGVYTLKVGLTSQRDDLIPLAEFIYDVDLCDDDSLSDDPIDPIDPVDPVDPVDPEDPEDPEDPVDSTQCPLPQNIDVDLSDVVLSTITLDGSQSQGVDGAEVSEYSWSVIQRPDGSTSGIKESGNLELEDDPSTPTAHFFLDLVGDYVIELNVIDLHGHDSSDEHCRGHQVAVHAFTDQEIHVQLTWTTPDDSDEQDDRGTDLDLHLLHPSASQWNSELDCYWRHRTGEWGADGPAGNASLDIDDVNGAGPENINVHRPEDTSRYQSDYRIGVYLYNPFIYDLMEARVRVYLNGELRAEYEHDLTHRAQLWEPAGIIWENQEGDLIEINRFYDEVDLNTQLRSIE
jgi:hypothetical protein